MDNILGYYVFDPVRGWICGASGVWSSSFHSAHEFASPEEANRVGEKASPGAEDTFYVFACLGSM